MEYNKKEELFDKIGGIVMCDKEELIPKFVAYWIEYCKNTFLSLARALAVSEEDFHNYANQKDHLDLLYFLGSMVNQEKFARAWIYGYKIEEDKKYKVKMKGVSESSCVLKYYYNSERWIMGTSLQYNNARLYHTKEELEAGGFGGVFNNPIFEVVEMAE